MPWSCMTSRPGSCVPVAEACGRPVLNGARRRAHIGASRAQRELAALRRQVAALQVEVADRDAALAQRDAAVAALEHRLTHVALDRVVSCSAELWLYCTK